MKVVCVLVWQVLSAINLVLSVCEINVVLGVDKLMVQRAIQNQLFGEDQCSEELADKFLRKIIQLPVTLPDPGDHKIRQFLTGQMGFLPMQANRKTLDLRESNYSSELDILVDHTRDTLGSANEIKSKLIWHTSWRACWQMTKYVANLMKFFQMKRESIWTTKTTRKRMR